jgi:hypothetical protein
MWTTVTIPVARNVNIYYVVCGYQQIYVEIYVQTSGYYYFGC